MARKPKSHGQFVVLVRKNASPILTGRMLVFDPASRKLGYVLYEEGIEVDCGEIELSNRSISKRLNELIHIVTAMPDLDVIAVERIRGNRAHEYLHWSVGVIVGSAFCDILIEVPVSTWHKFAGKGHIKSDINDARAMGGCIIAEARKAIK